jgi:hypothetical protein
MEKFEVFLNQIIQLDRKMTTDIPAVMMSGLRRILVPNLLRRYFTLVVFYSGVREF